MEVVSKLKLDLLNRGIAPVVEAVQNDANTRIVSATLYSGSSAWEPGAGVTAGLAYSKPDGTTGLYDQLPDATPAVKVSGNNAEITLAPQVLTTVGNVTAAIVFMNDSTLNRVASFPIQIRVVADPSGGKEKSNDYYKFSTMEEVSKVAEAAADAVKSVTEAVEKAEAAANFANSEAGKAASAAEAANTAVEGADAATKKANDAADRADTVTNTMQGLHDEMVAARDQVVATGADVTAKAEQVNKDAQASATAVETTAQNLQASNEAAENAATEATRSKNEADRAQQATDGKLDKPEAPATEGQVLKSVGGKPTWQNESGGSGTVTSVNGKPGPEVTLSAEDVGAQPAGDYATKAELSDGLAGKQDAGDYATVEALDAVTKALDGKQDAGDYATNMALNDGLALKLDIAPLGEATPEDTQEVHRTPDGKLVTAPSGSSLTLTATTEPGATVTATDGITTFTQEAPTGVAKFNIPKAGEWNIKANKDGNRIGEDNVTINSEYSVEIRPRTYTIRIALNNSNSETACTYMDDAIGKTPGHNGWKDTPLFKYIKPCIVKNGKFQFYLNKNNLAQKETGESIDITSITIGDVMVEIPKIGYRLWSDSEYQYASVTEEPNKPDYCYRAHSLDAEGDCDKIYIGAFLGWNSDNKLYSLSGKIPTTYTSLTSFRNYAQSKGNGYSLVSFYPLTLLQCLYLIKYKNLNSQNALGKGLVSQSSKANTGSTVAKGEDYGEQTGKQQMCFLNLEDFWGNLRQWTDGLYCDSNGNIKTDFKNFNDTGKDYQFILSGAKSGVSGFVSNVLGNNNGGFCVANSKGSSTTYYCDTGDRVINSVCCFGGDWVSGDSAGVFYIHVSDPASRADDYFGGRLMYKHKKEV